MTEIQSSMQILVGSGNPIKIEAARDAFSNYFDNVEVLGIEVDSGVSDQPINEATYTGALNRAKALIVINQERSLMSDFFVGIEGGVIEIASRWFAFGCMCVMNHEGLVGYGTSSHFELPESIWRRLLDGEELGKVIDELTNVKDSKRRQGAVGFLTRGCVNRRSLYIQGIQMALIPFINKGLYQGQSLARG